MIRLLLLAAVLLVGVIVGPMFAGNQGYVLISVANHTLEMSLTTLILFLGIFFLALAILWSILKKLLSLNGVTRRWLTNRKANKARQLTSNGLLKVIEGDWKQAEKMMIRSARHSEVPLLNYLAAAEAAQGQGDAQQRDEYLQQAAELDSDNLAVALTRAKLQYRQGQYEQAIATLQDIQHQHARNPILLKQLKECYLKLEDWKPLLALMPQLQKMNVVSEDEAKELTLQAEKNLMKQICQHSGSDGLMAHWNSLNRKTKQNPALIAAFVEQMSKADADSEAYKILRDALKKYGTDELIELVPSLKLADYHPAIVRLKDLLRYDSSNPSTHSALGQLFMREQKWEEAQQHLEKAIEGRPNVADYSRLATVMEKLNDEQGAAALSRQALTLALPIKDA